MFLRRRVRGLLLFPRREIFIKQRRVNHPLVTTTGGSAIDLARGTVSFSLLYALTAASSCSLLIESTGGSSEWSGIFSAGLRFLFFSADLRFIVVTSCVMRDLILTQGESIDGPLYDIASNPHPGA
jgi:hypothetical protein